jgi:hypothetical protein
VKTTETEGSVDEAASIDSTQPAKQVSLPRWAELKRAYVARQGTEHGTPANGAENAADPDPIDPAH